jgi:small-conductance mechanosensitive channel
MNMFLLAQLNPKPEEIAAAIEFFDLGRLLQTVIIIAVAYFGNRFIGATLDRLGEGQAKLRLLMKKISSFTRIAIFGVAGYLVAMTLLAGDKTALYGLGTTLLVALGFAMKDMASSIVSGILILIDRPFQVGDRVQFGDTYGEVKEIGLRVVRITTLDDNEVSIPNNKFLTDAVACGNSGALDMMVVVKFYIAINEDFDLARQIAYEACVTSKYVYLAKPVQVEIKDAVEGNHYITTLTCKSYVIDVRYEEAFATDITQRVKRAFRENKISYPYSRQFRVEDEVAEALEFRG